MAQSSRFNAKEPGKHPVHLSRREAAIENQGKMAMSVDQFARQHVDQIIREALSKAILKPIRRVSHELMKAKIPLILEIIEEIEAGTSEIELNNQTMYTSVISAFKEIALLVDDIEFLGEASAYLNRLIKIMESSKVNAGLNKAKDLYKVFKKIKWGYRTTDLSLVGLLSNQTRHVTNWQSGFLSPLGQETLKTLRRDVRLYQALVDSNARPGYHTDGLIWLVASPGFSRFKLDQDIRSQIQNFKKDFRFLNRELKKQYDSELLISKIEIAPPTNDRGGYFLHANLYLHISSNASSAKAFENHKQAVIEFVRCYLKCNVKAGKGSSDYYLKGPEGFGSGGKNSLVGDLIDTDQIKLALSKQHFEHRDLGPPGKVTETIIPKGSIKKWQEIEWLSAQLCGLKTFEAYGDFKNFRIELKKSKAKSSSLAGMPCTIAKASNAKKNQLKGKELNPISCCIGLRSNAKGLGNLAEPFTLQRKKTPNTKISWMLPGPYFGPILESAATIGAYNPSTIENDPIFCQWKMTSTRQAEANGCYKAHLKLVTEKLNRAIDERWSEVGKQAAERLNLLDNSAELSVIAVPPSMTQPNLNSVSNIPRIVTQISNGSIFVRPMMAQNVQTPFKLAHFTPNSEICAQTRWLTPATSITAVQYPGNKAKTLALYEIATGSQVVPSPARDYTIQQQLEFLQNNDLEYQLLGPPKCWQGRRKAA